MLVTERLRDCVPPSHDLLQVDQAEPADVAQCTGRAPWSQAWVLENVEPHALPPFCGWLQPRVANCVPLPHDVVQVPHAEQPV